MQRQGGGVPPMMVAPGVALFQPGPAQTAVGQAPPPAGATVGPAAQPVLVPPPPNAMPQSVTWIPA